MKKVYTFKLVDGRKVTTHTIELETSVIWSELGTVAARLLGLPRRGPVEWKDTVDDIDVFSVPLFSDRPTHYEGKKYRYPLVLLRSKGVSTGSL